MAYTCECGVYVQESLVGSKQTTCLLNQDFIALLWHTERMWKKEYHINYLFIIYFHGSTARIGPGPHYRGFTITLRHTTLGRTAGQVISLKQRPLPDSAQHSQEPDIHVPSGIWTHNPSKLVAEDPRLRPCGHWNRLPHKLLIENLNLQSSPDVVMGFVANVGEGGEHHWHHLTI
jgi:hypothetical protein